MERRRFDGVAYARVARDDGTRSWDAIESQQQANAAAATRLGIQVVAGFVDVGQSGTRTNRPGLNHLMAHIEDSPVDFVIVNSIDRLARTTKQLDYILQRIKKVGTTALLADSDTAIELLWTSDLEVLHPLTDGAPEEPR